MSPPVVLDMTRSVLRRLRGRGPSGIDRVCDAYAAHYAPEALAVLQLQGRPILLGRATSARLFDALGEPGNRLGREVLPDLLRAPFARIKRERFEGALYINVGHTGFDRDKHWHWVGALGLVPVYMVHDLIPLTHPQLTTPHKTWRHWGRVTSALSRADGIIANSQATAEELQRFACGNGIALPPMVTAPIAGAALPMPLQRETCDPPPFLTIGTIERRKNHILLLEVWQRLFERFGAKTPQLIVAGSDGLGAGEFHAALHDAPALRRFVSVRQGLGDAELGHLLASTRAVLMPTLAEGVGLPVVEALSARVPVIASDLPSLREFGQGIPSYLPPHAVEAWTELVVDHFRGGSDWQRQRGQIASYHAPSWHDHFVAVDPWLRRLKLTSAGQGFAAGADRLYRQPVGVEDWPARRGLDV